MKNNLSALNEIFSELSPSQRLKELYGYFDAKDILYTSSFGATAICLLHLVSKVRPEQTVHFLDTTYHFAETLAYKDMVAKQFGLTVQNILPDPIQNKLTQEEETYKDDPDLCCMVNKIVPMDAVKKDYKIWITGMLGYQTHFRAGMKVFEEAQGMIKFNPLIDMTSSEVKTYISSHNLPEHPLKSQGYNSIGCSHCTRKGQNRSGRWQGSTKTECGLHNEIPAVKC